MRGSEIQPAQQPVNLDVGLDFASPKVTAQPGSLSECYNHEITETLGMKRVDGFTRFDGHYLASFGQDGTVVQVNITAPSSLVTPALPGDQLNLVSSGERFGRIVYIDQNNFRFMYIIRFSNAQLEDDQVLNVRTSEQYTITISENPPIPGAIVDPPRARESVIQSNLIYDELQSRHRPLPNGRRAHGLHWFKDRLYAVVDDLYITFDQGEEEVFAGDEIQLNTAGYTAIIRDVVVTSGGWATDNAAGYIVIDSMRDVERDINNDPVDPYECVYVDTWAQQLVSVFRPDPGTVVADAFRIGSNSARITDPDTVVSASLWRCDNEERIDQDDQVADNVNLGWNPVDMGITLNFKDGAYFNRVFNTLNRTNANQTDNTEGQVVPSPTDSTNGGPSAGSDWSSAGAFTIPFPNAQNNGTLQVTGVLPYAVAPDFATESDYQAEDTDGLTYTWSVTTGNGVGRLYGNGSFSDWLGLSAIPANSVVSGIEIRARVFQTIGMADQLDPDMPTAIAFRLRRQTNQGGQATLPKYSEIDRSGNSFGNAPVLVFGGPTDRWGIEQLRIEDIDPANFFADMVFFSPPNPDGRFVDRSLVFDYIKIVIYYTAPGSKVYFWNGATDVSANIVGQWVRDGSLLLSTGVGTLQVYNLEAEGAGTRVTIQDGDEIRTAPGGAGDKLGEVDGDPYGSRLASLSQVLYNKSRYQAITANYYAREDWDAIYGVSGAGRAFVYDGDFFRNVFTGLADDIDKPRHVAYHHGHLALGYAAGVVQMSAAGNPEDYYTPGAFSEKGVGDRITGLLPMNGTTLGVFCEGSVWGIVGTNVGDFNTTVLSPDEGCIEYTVCDVGSPVWCSYNGISNYSQTAAYGDFLGNRLSAIVHPWLRGRLTKEIGNYGLKGAVNVVCAIAVPQKNQYRVFFSDGYILTMTLVGDRPAFSIQQYYVDDPPDLADKQDATNPLNLKIVVPIAHSSQVDSNGRQRIHIAHYSKFYPDTNTDEDLKWVWEVDQGWSFDGNPIAADFTTNYSFPVSPYQDGTQRNVLMFGQSHGYAQLVIDMAKNFQPPDQQYVNISLPRDGKEGTYLNDSDVLLRYDRSPYFTMAHVAKSGLLTAYRISSDAPNNEQVAVQPPYVCQALLVQTAQGGDYN